MAAGCETPSKSLPSQGWSGGAPAAPHLLNGNGDTRDLRSALASGEERRPPTHFAPWHLPLQPENAQRRRPRRSARATDSDESGDEAPAAVGETGANNSDDMLDPFWNLVSSLTSTLHTCVAPSRRSQPSASAQSDDCGACCGPCSFQLQFECLHLAVMRLQPLAALRHDAGADGRTKRWRPELLAEQREVRVQRC